MSTLGAVSRERGVDITARELCSRLGITYRQLDYWLRCGMLEDNAAGSGSTRTFTPSDIRALTLAARLRSAGWSIADTTQLLAGYIDPRRLREQAQELLDIADQLEFERSWDLADAR